MNQGILDCLRTPQSLSFTTTAVKWDTELNLHKGRKLPPWNYDWLEATYSVSKYATPGKLGGNAALSVCTMQARQALERSPLLSAAFAVAL